MGIVGSQSVTNDGYSRISIGNERWVPICPDFLWRLVALIHSMRLSLMKGAHADLSGTAWKKIGAKPFFGLSGITSRPTQTLYNPSNPSTDTPRNKSWVPHS